MPFSHVKNHYQPEQLAVLSQAFNLAWPRVLIANGAFTQTELNLLREELANYIITCASGGEFDPEKLKEMALFAFVQRSQMVPSAASVSFFGGLGGFH